MKPYRSTSLFFVLLVLVSILAPPLAFSSSFFQEPAGNWDPDYMDVVADNDGRFHYVISNTSAIYYGLDGPTGISWQFVTLLDQPSPSRVAIVVDRDGDPTIVYADLGTLYSVEPAPNGEWPSTTLIASSGINSMDAVLDADEVLHVGYARSTSYIILRYDNGAVSWTTIGESILGDVNMELGPDGTPHMVYANTDGRVRLYHGSIETIMERAGLGNVSPTMAVTPDGLITVAVPWSFSLYIVSQSTSGSWSEDRIAASRGAVMVADGSGELHILSMDDLFTDSSQAFLSYIHRPFGGTWTSETVASGPDSYIFGLAASRSGAVAGLFREWTASLVTAIHSSSLELLSPLGGEYWAAGSRQEIRWTGRGEVDVHMSDDAGATYSLIAEGVRGGIADVLAPQWNSPDVRVRLTRDTPRDVAESPGLLAVAPNLESPWWAGVVDSGPETGFRSSIALGPDGNAHVVYSELNGSELWYARYREGQWEREMLVGVSVPQGYLAVDAEGVPHVAYMTWDGLDTIYMTPVDGVWISEVVDSGVDFSAFASIVADDFGNVHLAYYDSGADELKYAVRESGSWTPELVTFGSGIGWGISLAVDSQGNPRLCTLDGSNDDLLYAFRLGTSNWIPETVESIGEVGRYPAMVLDDEDNPHIAYRLTSASGYELHYAIRKNAAWRIEVLEHENYPGNNNSIALDPKGNPNIVHTAGSTLRLVRRIGDRWSTSNLVSEAIRAEQPFIAIAEDGAYHVSYYNDTDGVLSYLTTGLHLLTPTAGSAWEIGSTASLSWEGKGAVDIYLSADNGDSYTKLASAVTGGSYDFEVPDLPSRAARVKILRPIPYAEVVSNGRLEITHPTTHHWWTMDAATDGTNGESPALALDSEGRPHVSFQEEDNGVLQYAHRSGSSWETETVDATFSSGSYTSIAMNSADEPHIAYMRSVGSELHYASRTEGVWSTELITADGVIGYYASLAIDRDDIPHVMYWDIINSAVMYAVKREGAWIFETIESRPGLAFGYAGSLTLDADGVPHVIYAEGEDDDVLYAVRTESGWITETFDPDAVVSSTMDVAVDAAGVVHAAYRDDVSGLRYAQRAGNAWTIENLNISVRQSSFAPISIAVTAEGTPWLAYETGNPSIGTGISIAYRFDNGWRFEAITDETSAVWNDLAIDADGNARVIYKRGSDGVLRYSSFGLEIGDLTASSVWPVGSTRTVTWTGAGPVDIELTVDGGATYRMLEQDVPGQALGLVIPHTPSRFCRVRLTRSGRPLDPAGSYTTASRSTSTGFFTIEATIALAFLRIQEAVPGEIGTLVSWETDPGPEDLRNYRLDRKAAGTENWITLSDTITEPQYVDREATSHSGQQYRLFARNGLGGEILMGEVSARAAQALAASPVPYGVGSMSIDFSSLADFTGEEGPVDLAIYDVSGRRLRQLLDEPVVAGQHTITWEGLDDRGERLSPGIYFLRLQTAGMQRSLKFSILR